MSKDVFEVEEELRGGGAAEQGECELDRLMEVFILSKVEHSGAAQGSHFITRPEKCLCG